ncbi:MAG TPA: SDR family oxidoreductase [Actinomycetales bacterium]
MSDLDGRSVLVVGASGVLGGLIAQGLHAGGARLTLSGRSTDALERLGLDGAHHVSADLLQPGSPAQLVDAALEAHGAVDGVVFAAGVVAFGGVDEIDDDVADELLVVNYLAAARLARAALPHLPPGGFIVNISAVVAETPAPGMAAYCASKAALTAFDAVLRTQARRTKVRVVDARPPHTETGLAGRPLVGTAPRLPRGLSPQSVADRIVRAVVDDEADLPSSAFG